MAHRHPYKWNRSRLLGRRGVWGSAFHEHTSGTDLRNSRGGILCRGHWRIIFSRQLFITDDALLAMLAPNHSNARAAVSRLLFNPASAQFDQLRTVEVDEAKYVCGNVNAKDQSGSYAGYHAFVYTVAVDFARIDDEGRIAQRHAAFSACPAPEEEKVAQQKMAIAPGALSLVKGIQKNIPASGDPSTLSKMASQMSAPDKSSSGAPMEQQLRQLGGAPFGRAARV